MQFYKFWAIGDGSAVAKNGDVIFRSAYGYSNESLADALHVAKTRAEQVAVNWTKEDTLGNYYPSGAIREEIVEQLEDDLGVTALISRNSYGALVLNAPHVFFADVDIPLSELKKANSWFRFFKKPSGPGFEAKLVAKINSAITNDPTLGMRLYRTKLGYRILVTSKTIATKDPESKTLMSSLGSDGLYARLCESQNCYRARLSPKPWRCQSARRPPSRFPFLEPGCEANYRTWESAYDRITKKFATCALIGDFGNDQRDSRVQFVLRLHDRYVLNGEKPLA